MVSLVLRIRATIEQQLWPAFTGELHHILHNRKMNYSHHLVTEQPKSNFRAVVLCNQFLILMLRVVYYGQCLHMFPNDRSACPEMVMDLFNRTRTLDYLIYWCFGSLYFYGFYSHRAIYYKPLDFWNWNIVAQVIVANHESWAKMRRRQSNRESPIEQIRRSIRIVRRLIEEKPVLKINNFIKTNFTLIPPSVIRTIVTSTFLIDLYLVSIILIIVSVGFCMYFYYIFLIYLEHFNWLRSLILVVDVANTILCLLFLLRVSMVIVATLILISYFYSSFYHASEKRLQHFYTRQQTFFRKTMPIRGDRVERIDRQYQYGINYMERCNRNLWSHWNYVFVLNNIPINVYFMTFLIHGSANINDQLVLFLLILAFQLFCLIVLCLTFAAMCIRVHRPSRFYFPLQLLMMRNFHSKYKLMTHCELIHSNQKITFTAGPLGPITYLSVLRAFIMYLSLMSYANQLLSNH